MMRDSKGEPITPGGLMPRGMCQPPVNAMALIKRLSPEDMTQVLRVVAIWAPEILEKGLQRISEEREAVADYYREQRAGAAANPGLHTYAPGDVPHACYWCGHESAAGMVPCTGGGDCAGKWECADAEACRRRSANAPGAGQPPRCGPPATCGEFGHEHPHIDDAVTLDVAAGECPGCTGRGTGPLCCICGLPVPPGLRRRPGDPSEIGGAR